MSDSQIIARGTPRTQYLADGSQSVFSFPYPFFEAEDLAVYLGAALQHSGYSVSGAGASEGGGVSFSTAPAAGTVITLMRRVPVERISDFLDSGPLGAGALNREFDRLTACLQQVAGDQALMLHYPLTDLPASTELPSRAARLNRLFAFDGSGAPTVALPRDTDAQIDYLPPGAGASARSVRDRLADQISVKDFGAVGDGVVDDTVAIQAALTAHRAVFVPPGRYRLTNTITVGYGQTLAGAGPSSILQAADASFDVLQLPDGYACVHHLRLERGLAGVRLYGRDGPCVQNNLTDLLLWEPQVGLVFDGYSRADRPCYWNNVARVLIARPALHGVWFTLTGAGDTPNANRLHWIRVYSLGAPLAGCGFFIEHGRYNNAFVDCEANLWPEAKACFHLGAHTNKNLLVNLYCESLGSVPNVQLDAGSVETAIINLFSASAGPAIYDLSGGQYTAFNAGYPTKNRLGITRITDLTVEALRYDTEFHDPPAGGLFEPDLTSAIYLVSGYNGPVEVRLPPAGSATGSAVTIKKTDASDHAVTVTEAGAIGPDGRPMVLASCFDYVTAVSNGANWWITATNLMPGNAGFYEGASPFCPDLSRGFYLVSAFSGPLEVRLPAPGATEAVGRTVTIKKSDQSANVVTVTSASGGGPDNEAIRLTAFGHAVTTLSNGGGWHIISRNL